MMNKGAKGRGPWPRARRGEKEGRRRRRRGAGRRGNKMPHQLRCHEHGTVPPTPSCDKSDSDTRKSERGERERRTCTCACVDFGLVSTYEQAGHHINAVQNPSRRVVSPLHWHSEGEYQLKIGQEKKMCRKDASERERGRFSTCSIDLAGRTSRSHCRA